MNKNLLSYFFNPFTCPKNCVSSSRQNNAPRATPGRCMEDRPHKETMSYTVPRGIRRSSRNIHAQGAAKPMHEICSILQQEDSSLRGLNRMPANRTSSELSETQQSGSAHPCRQPTLQNPWGTIAAEKTLHMYFRSKKHRGPVP